MKPDWSFLRLAGAWFVGITAIALYPLSRFASAEATESFVVAGVLGLANVVVGSLAVEYSFPKSNTTFLKILLGSMLARLVLMGTAVVVLVEVLLYPPMALMISLLLFYSVNLALEIYYLQKKVALRHQQ